MFASCPLPHIATYHAGRKMYVYKYGLGLWHLKGTWVLFCDFSKLNTNILIGVWLGEINKQTS